jgi:hypothetical protein
MLELQNPESKTTQYLNAGQVGYIIVGMRTTSESKVGDTLFAANHDVDPFPGFKPARPMVRPRLTVLVCDRGSHIVVHRFSLVFSLWNQGRGLNHCKVLLIASP